MCLFAFKNGVQRIALMLYFCTMLVTPVDIKKKSIRSLSADELKDLDFKLMNEKYPIESCH